MWRATSAPFMLWGAEPLRERFRCSTGFLGGEELSLCLSSAIVDKSDRISWWERIELGQVTSITCHPFAQILDSRGERAWAAAPEYPLVQRRVLTRLPLGDLADDLMGLRGFRACFDDLGCVVGLTPADCFGPRGKATLTMRNALPPAVHNPLYRLAASVCVFRGSCSSAPAETGCVRLGTVRGVGGPLRGQEL